MRNKWIVVWSQYGSKETMIFCGKPMCRNRGRWERWSKETPDEYETEAERKTAYLATFALKIYIDLICDGIRYDSKGFLKTNGLVILWAISLTMKIQRLYWKWVMSGRFDSLNLCIIQNGMSWFVNMERVDSSVTLFWFLTELHTKKIWFKTESEQCDQRVGQRFSTELNFWTIRIKTLLQLILNFRYFSYFCFMTL